MTRVDVGIDWHGALAERWFANEHAKPSSATVMLLTDNTATAQPDAFAEDQPPGPISSATRRYTRAALSRM